MHVYYHCFTYRYVYFVKHIFENPLGASPSLEHSKNINLHLCEVEAVGARSRYTPFAVGHDVQHSGLKMSVCFKRTGDTSSTGIDNNSVQFLNSRFTHIYAGKEVRAVVINRKALTCPSIARCLAWETGQLKVWTGH